MSESDNMGTLVCFVVTGVVVLFGIEYLTGISAETIAGMLFMGMAAMVVFICVCRTVYCMWKFAKMLVGTEETDKEL